jgi:glycosyltransferase involved in cell wall biosynthesis
MDKEIPLVSIVTPSLNQGRFIEETILSVKNQTYPRIEHIVIDGGSTDDTLDILKKYSDSLIWISEPDKGQSDAINKGWIMAKGEIIAYLNSDDTYMPWAVETAVKFLIDNPDVGMVYGDCNIVDEHSRVIGQYPATEFNLSELICSKNMIPQPTVFFRRQVLETVGYADVNLHMAMDFDLWVRIGLKYNVQYIPGQFANFRAYPGTKSMEGLYKFVQDHLYTLGKLFSSHELPEGIASLKRRAYSSVHLMSGVHYHSLRRMKQARKYFIKAVVIYPKNLVNHPLLLAYLITSFMGARVTELLVGWKRRFTARPIRKSQMADDDDGGKTTEGGNTGH